MLRVNSDPTVYTGDSHAPVPFFVSTKGYGMYFDTARYAEFFCGYNKKHRRNTEHSENKMITNTQDLYARGNTGSSAMSVLIPGAEGIDVYIFEGKNILGALWKEMIFNQRIVNSLR